MKKIGTFYDRVTSVDYDLYTINARELKERLDKTLKLTNLKMAMFNESSQVLTDINVETIYGEPETRLEFDYKKGEILNREVYKKRGDDYRCIRILETEEKGVGIDEVQEEYHQMGYELLPIVVSAKERNIEKEVKLLDGFRRMYYTNEIPDVDIFVKVYDELEPQEWQNAMLLFNSWKIAEIRKWDLTGTVKHANYFDRGYKYGLYTQFGIDVTQKKGITMNLILNYINGRFYEVLKDNRVAHIDIETSLAVDYRYINEYSEYRDKTNTEDRKERINIGYMLEELYKHYGLVRVHEYKRGTQKSAKVITEESIQEFMESEEMKPHLKKIRSMQVQGHIDNYIKKHTTIHILNYLRAIYGKTPIDLKYTAQCVNYSKKYAFDEVTNEKLEGE